MPTHPSHHDPGDATATRTRLPEGESAALAAGRRPSRTSRPMVTVVGVVVLLIAALAFATRGSSGGGTGSGGDSDKGGQAAPTAPTGVRPVSGNTGGVATGFPKTEQGAQSAAANYAVALGGDGMFKTNTRHTIIDSVYTEEAAAKLKPTQDQAYSRDFLGKLGLDANGNPPSGMSFISRTIPVGTKVEQYGTDTATVSVWYTGLIGMAGNSSTDPVHTNWMTWTFNLVWTGSDWKVASDSQKNGPAPVPGDDTAATAADIAKAVSQYGGFTYAR